MLLKKPTPVSDAFLAASLLDHASTPYPLGHNLRTAACIGARPRIRHACAWRARHLIITPSRPKLPCDLSAFERIRYRHHDTDVFLYAFDLIELDGNHLRRDPLAVRKATLASLLSRAAPGLRFNEHLDEEDGPLVFAHACKLGPEGIVSKRHHFALPFCAITGLDQEQEPGRAGR